MARLPVSGRTHIARLLAAGCAAALLAACGGSRTQTVVQRTRTVVSQHVSSPPRTTAPPSLQSLMSRVQSGIVRIVATDCFGGDIGTGFELSPRLVATVEHVIDGASSIRLTQNGQTVAEASVIGADPSQDLALLLTDRPLSGRALTLADRPPQLGESVAAVGFPLNLPLSVTQGTVSGLNRTIPIDGYMRHNLIQTDAAVNPGNSGGPLLSIDSGDVIGLVDLGTDQANGLGFAVSSTVALQEFSQWQSHPGQVRSIRCPSTSAAASSTTTVPVLPTPGNTQTTGTATTGTATTGTATTGTDPPDHHRPDPHRHARHRHHRHRHHRHRHREHDRHQHHGRLEMPPVRLPRSPAYCTELIADCSWQ